MIRTVLLVTLFAIVAVAGFSMVRVIQTAHPVTDMRSSDTSSAEGGTAIPAFLSSTFPDTDFSNAAPAIEDLLSGGPGKDGIPALDEPTFVSLHEFDRPDSVQVIVLEDEDSVRVYPYNILTWHEIVNDIVAGVPVAITFCPLCGSAIVYERTLPDGTVSTLGVSGALIESNMVMYDRQTESLWQQSTGEGLAGVFVGERLEPVQFQLMTLGEVRKTYPRARVLSEETSYSRDYAYNPYSGYDDSDEFLFPPSNLDTRLPSKEIVVAFRIDGTPVAFPWDRLAQGTRVVEVGTEQIDLTRVGSTLSITRESGETIPFYFEMWFSFAVQNQEDGVLLEL